MIRSEIYAAYVAAATAAGIRVLSNTSFQSKSEIIAATPAAIDHDAPDVSDIAHDGTMHVAPVFASVRLLAAPSRAIIINPTFDIADPFADIAAFIDASPVAVDAPRGNTLAALELSGRCGYIHDKLTPRDRGRARRWWRNIHGAVDHTLFGRWAVSTVPVELCDALGVACHPTPRG